MQEQNNALATDRIRRMMGQIHTVGKQLIWLDEVGSTNDYAKELAMRGAEDGTVVIADHQTAGRGRLSRSFQSAEGKGIYLSVMLRPNLAPKQLISVTALAGVAVCDAVEEVCGVRPGLKWPNDPVLNGKKVGGILTELTIDAESGDPCLILGIGINVEQTTEDFTPDVAQFATSLTQELGRPFSREALIAALLRELERLIVALRKNDLTFYLASFRQNCVNLGKTVQIIGRDHREIVQAIDIDEDFGLVVRTADGTTKTIRSGEVSVRGMYGYVE